MTEDFSPAPPQPTGSPSMAPPHQPPLAQVIDYDAPRVDQVPRQKYVALIVVAAALGAILLLLLVTRLLVRPSNVVVGRAVAPRPTPIVTPAPAPAAQAQSMRDSVAGRRLNELLNNRLGPEVIVYEEEPVAAKRLRGDSSGVVNQQASRDGMSQPLWGAFEPPAYRASGFWENGVTNESHDALLFAHTLTSPGGNTRLVMLEMEVKLASLPAPKDEYRVAINRKLKYRICDTKLVVNTPHVLRHGTSLTVSQSDERNTIPVKWLDGTLRAARPTEHHLRFFAGQPDPNDPSHFTIDYQVGPTRGTIDGWLTDDDFLRIVPNGGQVDKGTWHIDK